MTLTAHQSLRMSLFKIVCVVEIQINAATLLTIQPRESLAELNEPMGQPS